MLERKWGPKAFKTNRAGVLIKQQAVGIPRDSADVRNKKRVLQWSSELLTGSTAFVATSRRSTVGHKNELFEDSIGSTSHLEPTWPTWARLPGGEKQTARGLVPITARTEINVFDQSRR